MQVARFVAKCKGLNKKSDLSCDSPDLIGEILYPSFVTLARATLNLRSRCWALPSGAWKQGEDPFRLLGEWQKRVRKVPNV